MTSSIKVILLFFVIVVFSCEQNSELSRVDDPRRLADVTVASSKFKNLDVSVSNLNTSASKFINDERRSILIPFRGIDDRKGVIALFSDQYTLIEVAMYEVKTSIPSEMVFDALKNETFDGTFIFLDENARIEIAMERSKIISSKGSKYFISGRGLSCNGMTEPGGALDCAGNRLVNMNWFDAAICYASFVPCMAQLVVSCMIDGCPMY
jgi:hypothetical protein